MLHTWTDLGIDTSYFVNRAMWSRVGSHGLSICVGCLHSGFTEHLACTGRALAALSFLHQVSELRGLRGCWMVVKYAEVFFLNFFVAIAFQFDMASGPVVAMTRGGGFHRERARGPWSCAGD